MSYEENDYKILEEKIEKQGDLYLVRLLVKIPGKRFPVEKIKLVETEEEARIELWSFKKEYLLNNKQYSPNTNHNINNFDSYAPNRLPASIKWAFGLIVAQILYNAAMAVEMGESFASSIGISVGAHVLTIIAAVLFYKAYKNK